MPSDTLGELLSWFRQANDLPADDPYLAPESDLFDYGYLDSFGVVRFTVMVKESYGVDLAPVNFYDGEFRTARQLAAYIDAQRSSGAS